MGDAASSIGDARMGTGGIISVSILALPSELSLSTLPVPLAEAVSAMTVLAPDRPLVVQYQDVVWWERVYPDLLMGSSEPATVAGRTVELRWQPRTLSRQFTLY